MELNDLENNSNTIGMYSFYDKKAKRFDTPFYCAYDLFAGRHYKMLTYKEDTMLNTFKFDYDVHRLGFFDLESGTFLEKHEVIIQGKFQKEEK